MRANRKQSRGGPPPEGVAAAGRLLLPEVDFSHLRRLTDETGLLQHARGTVPKREHGYCTDDNARALIVATLAAREPAPPVGLEDLAACYLSFLHHAFNQERRVFRNLMSYDRRWSEPAGSRDSNGRAVWALGVAAAEHPDERLRRMAADLLLESLPALEAAADLRAIAFALLGLGAALARGIGEPGTAELSERLAARLHAAFVENACDEAWPWPEAVLTYANARVPHALIESGARLGREEWVDCGRHSLQWLVEMQTENGCFSPVGNRGWYRRGGTRARFDQQPIEADAMVAACVAALRATGAPVWRDRAVLALRWFLGHNVVGEPLYDAATGGCRDGLGEGGSNENEGAESTLAWLSALLIMRALRREGVLREEGGQS
jgi:hypothetical protein